MIRINDVEYIKAYTLELTFNNGEVHRVDLEELLDKPAYSALKASEKFKQFGLVRGTIEWIDNIDVAPEYLYELCQQQAAISK